MAQISHAFFAATEVGVRELLIAGGTLGIGLLLVIWGILSRKREVPGHARDGAQQLTRDLIDELESRAERLERLMERAEAKISELREAERRVVPRTPISMIEPRPQRAPEPSIFTDPTHQEVCGMSDAGMSSVEIARRLQMPTGQVELILNLRPKPAPARA